MSAKHTPGEWVVDSPHPDGAIGIRSKDLFGLLVAIARYSDNPRISKERAEANARLIAAGPELLEAAILVRAILAVLETVGEDALCEIFYGKSGVNDLRRAIDRIGAAIAKAEGRES